MVRGDEWKDTVLVFVEGSAQRRVQPLRGVPKAQHLHIEQQYLARHILSAPVRAACVAEEVETDTPPRGAEVREEEEGGRRDAEEERELERKPHLHAYAWHEHMHGMCKCTRRELEGEPDLQQPPDAVVGEVGVTGRVGNGGGIQLRVQPSVALGAFELCRMLLV